MNFEGKVVLVTGSSRGIGRAIVEAFAQKDAQVIINYRKSKEEAELLENALLSEGFDAWAIQADITKEEDRKWLVALIASEYGGIDIVVHNAFAPYTFDPEQRTHATKLAWEDYARQLVGSFRPVVELNHQLLPLMQRRGSGRVIHIVTNLIAHPAVSYSDYTTAKGALLTYTRQLARDVGRYGITVNAIAPGLVYPTSSSRATKKEVRDRLIAQTPLGRLTNPEDIAGPTLFLASDYAQMMTGQTLYVDGGLTMRERE